MKKKITGPKKREWPYLSNPSIENQIKKVNKRFFFEFAISFFLGLSDQVEILGKVGKELDGTSLQRFFFYFFCLSIKLPLKEKESRLTNRINGFKFFFSLFFPAFLFLIGYINYQSTHTHAHLHFLKILFNLSFVIYQFIFIDAAKQNN